MAQDSLSSKDVQDKLQVSPSPHIRARKTVKWTMNQVLISMIPPTIAAIFFFGWWVIVQMFAAVATALVSEYLFQKLTYQKVTIDDRSAAVTGSLVGLSFPVTSPLWVVIVSSAFAIIVVKQWNGGLGRNYLNPAVTARVTAKALFTPFFANWVLPGGLLSGPYGGADAISSATPLEYIGQGARTVADAVPSLWELFLGVNLGGNIGETSKLAILIGFLYLIFRRVINPKVPLLFVGSAMLVAVFWSSFDIHFAMVHALSGTLIFAATYMATDYSSGSLTPEGKTVFAIAGGALTMVLRLAFNFPGGVGISIIIMNICAPFIDSKLMPRIYGHRTRPDVKFDRQKYSKPK